MRALPWIAAAWVLLLVFCTVVASRTQHAVAMFDVQPNCGLTEPVPGMGFCPDYARKQERRT